MKDYFLSTKIIYPILFAFIILVSSCAGSQDQTNQEQNTVKETAPVSNSSANSDKSLKIIAFGNSTTASRNGINQVYPERLEAILETEGYSIEMINEGVAGSHTGSVTDNSKHNVLHAMDRVNEQVRAKNPDLVIISFGMNDAWVDEGDHNSPSRIPIENYRNNLGSIVQTLVSENVKVVLMTPNPLGKSYENWRNDRLSMYADVVRELANQFSLPMVDNWSSFMNYGLAEGQEIDDLLLDGMHPNDQGHEIIAGDLGANIVYFLGQ